MTRPITEDQVYYRVISVYKAEEPDVNFIQRYIFIDEALECADSESTLYPDRSIYVQEYRITPDNAHIHRYHAADGTIHDEPVYWYEETPLPY